MDISFNPLWKLLIDRKLSRSELRRRAGISTRALAKMGKDQDVSMEVLRKVCSVLDCGLGDIVEMRPNTSSESIPLPPVESGLNQKAATENATR